MYGSNCANKEKGLPRSILMLTLNDKDTGAPVAYMSANILSAYRTGAVPGVGYKHLSKPDSKVAAIIGPGVMSKTALAAIMAVRPGIETLRSRQRKGIPGKVHCPCEERISPGECVCCGYHGRGSPGCGYCFGKHLNAYRRPQPVSVYQGGVDQARRTHQSTAALRFDDDFIIHRARTVTDNIKLYEAWEEEMKPNAYNTVPIPAVHVMDLIAEGRSETEQGG